MIVKTVIKSLEMRTKDEVGKKDLQNNPNTTKKMSARACVHVQLLSQKEHIYH